MLYMKSEMRHFVEVTATITIYVFVCHMTRCSKCSRLNSSHDWCEWDLEYIERLFTLGAVSIL